MSTPRRWPLFLIAAPAAVAVWSGWVGLGGMCGFGIVHPLPGVAPGFQLNSAVTLPVGVEAYGSYALGAWLAGGIPDQARTFAKRSAIGSLMLGMLGRVCYHVLSAAHATRAPWPVVVLVACLPVVVLGLGVGLAHLLRPEGEPAQVTVREAIRGTERVSRSPAHYWTLAESDAAQAISEPRPSKRTSQACAKWRDHPDVNAILRDTPGISGAEFGRKLGVSPRHGQRILAAIAAD
jgi:hypothetical protein